MDSVKLLVSSAMMLCLREANENRPRPLAHATPLPGMTASACHVLAYHQSVGLGTLEVAATRRDRRDLVPPSPCSKLIRARPGELHVTTVRGREYA